MKGRGSTLRNAAVRIIFAPTVRPVTRGDFPDSVHSFDFPAEIRKLELSGLGEAGSDIVPTRRDIVVAINRRPGIVLPVHSDRLSSGNGGTWARGGFRCRGRGNMRGAAYGEFSNATSSLG